MPTNQKKKLEVAPKWFLILHLSLIVNSMAGVASKFAGRYPFLSLGFCFFYGMVLFITFAFAIVWQQVLKNMSLTFAFTNKPITVIYSLLWGAGIFGEKITPRMVIGSLVILAGIVVGVSGNDEPKEKRSSLQDTQKVTAQKEESRGDTNG